MTSPQHRTSREERPVLSLSRREWITVTVTTAVFVVALGFLGFFGSRQVVASALVDAGPGGTTDAVLDVSPDVANRYVQTELVYIDILQPSIAEAIRAQGMQPGPIGARQEGTTSIVDISAQTGDAESSARQANIAAEVYIEDWRSRATSDLRRLQQNAQSRIADINQRLQALGDSSQDRAEAAGLRSELTRLTQELSDLQFREGGVRASNRIVESASPATALSRSSTVIYALLGFVLGAFAGLALVVYRRVRSSAHQEGDDDTAGGGAPGAA